MKNHDDRNWPKDEFAQREVAQFSGLILIAAIGVLAALVLPAISWLRRESKSEVVVYAAQDQIYAEPILREFEKQTGIKVKAVYDSEAVKTVGLANRLVAERRRPQCDVFWGNEEMRMRQLAAQNVFRETNGWTAFGYRNRQIVVNTNHVRSDLGGTRSTASETSSNISGTGWNPSLPAAPRSLLELTNENWRGKVALAYPQFGTTATHFHALRQLWGEEHWLVWCRALAANKPLLVDGNSVVVKFVGAGNAWIGLTDSDDIAAGQHEERPIVALPINAEMLLIPNTVAVIRGAPHPHNAQRLFEYLQRPEIARQLVAAKALEGISEKEVTVSTLKPDWERLLRDLETTTKQLNEIFLR